MVYNVSERSLEMKRALFAATCLLIGLTLANATFVLFGYDTWKTLVDRTIFEIISMLGLLVSLRRRLRLGDLLIDNYTNQIRDAVARRNDSDGSG
jgi:hypothetical protein